MNIPLSLVLIPDGNRTWAKKLGQPSTWGHTKGLETVQTIIDQAFKIGITHVVFWAASELNLRNRSEIEVNHLFKLMRSEMESRLAKSDQVKFKLVGAWQQFTNDQVFINLVSTLEKNTKDIKGKELTILFGYSGKTEMIEAIKELQKSDEHITDQSIRSHLWSGYLPDIDLVIRTGVNNDPHWSDSLLMWQTGNSQLYFTETSWPDFSATELQTAIDNYSHRLRKMGK